MNNRVDYATEQARQAAADTLSQYSLQCMQSLGTGVPPAQLRFQLMKKLSGVPEPGVVRVVDSPETAPAEIANNEQAPGQ
mmetsp:Transcript_40459/g.128915  ORF Transcript_40459/g.128915 Transcript_40459/m.128915 type:complete len:80 (+) Transcript_40459:176-415(+)